MKKNLTKMGNVPKTRGHPTRPKELYTGIEADFRYMFLNNWKMNKALFNAQTLENRKRIGAIFDGDEEFAETAINGLWWFDELHQNEEFELMEEAMCKLEAVIAELKELPIPEVDPT